MYMHVIGQGRESAYQCLGVRCQLGVLERLYSIFSSFVAAVLVAVGERWL